MKIACDKPEMVVRRMFWLAWQACGRPLGMGVLQDNHDADEDEVWINVEDRGDYPHGKKLSGPGVNDGKASGDYVFGRMMKLRVEWDNEGVKVLDSEPRRDYQSWCGKFPTYESLVRAAIESLAKGGA